ncbi:hypothetical protein EDC94DRAFT_647142 [Helicostylum pulchrum]|nr:hypothetical protein EDC94DRAFT_647142 [Helicostylum pulchrum]
MDLLKEFAKEHEKVNIRDFFRREYEDVHLYNTQIDSGLRNHWSMIVDEFVINYANKKVTKNLFKIDWEELYNTCIMGKNKKRLRSSVIQEHTSIVNDVVNEVRVVVGMRLVPFTKNIGEKPSSTKGNINCAELVTFLKPRSGSSGISFSYRLINHSGIANSEPNNISECSFPNSYLLPRISAKIFLFLSLSNVKSVQQDEFSITVQKYQGYQ